jgi:hypothetical protein
MDPTGQRDGKPPVEQAARTLERTASEAEAAVSSKQAAAGKPMTMAFIEEFVQNIKGAVMIAFPQGLPDYDPVAQILAGREDLAGRADSLEVLDPATAVLWFAGKKLAREDALEKCVRAFCCVGRAWVGGKRKRKVPRARSSHAGLGRRYIGRNEKTRIKAKLARPEQGAPQRTSAVDEETRKRIVALYHKREAERRRLEEEADETPAAGEWANPNAFRQSVAGFGGGVNFKLV